jgi:hypothetical protein
MKRKAIATILVLLIFAFLIPIVQAQAPEPPDVDTLGPVVFFYQSGKVAILSPENSTTNVNPIQLRFTVEAPGMFGQFGNVGVSLDGGVINSVTELDKSVVQEGPDWYWYKTTAQAMATLPTLSMGTHTVTVYYGWQYLGIPENPSLLRYEVSAHATVTFVIVNSSIHQNMPPTSDLEEPLITIQMPQNATYLLNEVSLDFVLNEPTSKMIYCLDEGENVTVTGNFTLTDLSNGAHNLTLYAWDSAGNVGASETITFTVDRHPESTFQIEPLRWLPVGAVSVAVAVVVAVAAVVYLKKRKH